MSGSANKGLSNDLLIPTNYDRDTFTLSYELNAEKHQGKVTLYNTETQIIRDESVMAAGRWHPNRLYENTAKNQNFGLNGKFQSDLAIAQLDNRMTYGFDYIDKMTASYYGASKYVEESTVSTAVFVEDQLFLADSFSITAGLRYDDYKRKAVTATDNFDAVTWALATEWQIAQDWTLFASTRSLFKGPELLETFIAYQKVSFLDEGLRAETGQNTQGGIRFDKQVRAHSFGANLTVFLVGHQYLCVKKTMCSTVNQPKRATMYITCTHSGCRQISMDSQ